MDLSNCITLNYRSDISNHNYIVDVTRIQALDVYDYEVALHLEGGLVIETTEPIEMVLTKIQSKGLDAALLLTSDNKMERNYGEALLALEKEENL